MTGGWLWWSGFALACFLFCVVLYSRWRMRQEPLRGGYIHHRDESRDERDERVD